MSRLVKGIILNIIIIVVLVGGGALGYFYYYQSTNFVKTDNAMIDAKVIPLSASASGTLSTYDLTVGKHISKDDTIAEITTQDASGKAKKVPVKAPQEGTVVQANDVEDQLVQQGASIGQAYNKDDMYITANIDEANIEKIEKGQKVDIKIDAFADKDFTGHIETITNATASSFSLLPSSNSDANYTKVGQVVPVKISIDNAQGFDLRPGMNVSVKVHI